MTKSFMTPVSLLAAIVRTAPDALLVVDAHDRIMFANERTESLFGYPRDELMGESVSTLLPGRYGGVVESSPVGHGQLLRASAKQGDSVPVEIRSRSVPFEGGELTAYLIRDVSDREEADREARRLRAQIAHVGRLSALGELVTSIAHEINQPLAAILSSAQAAQRFLGRSDPDLQEIDQALGEIVAANRRASEVISHLRSMIRREVESPVRLDLGDLLANIDLLLGKDAVERRIELRLATEPGLPAIEGDPIQLQQVLLNLVLNGFDAIARADRTDGTVSVSVSGCGADSIEVVVRDNGAGLVGGDEERIFEAFFTTKASGLGMGLSIARTIVETHGGRLTAERGEECGAVFRLTLPTVS